MYWRTSRATPGGGRQSPGSSDDSKYALPQNSILSPSLPLERSEITQALFDVGAVGFWFLLFSLLGVGAAGAFYILFVMPIG